MFFCNIHYDGCDDCKSVTRRLRKCRCVSSEDLFKTLFSFSNLSNSTPSKVNPAETSWLEEYFLVGGVDPLSGAIVRGV